MDCCGGERSTEVDIQVGGQTVADVGFEFTSGTLENDDGDIAMNEAEPNSDSTEVEEGVNQPVVEESDSLEDDKVDPMIVENLVQPSSGLVEEEEGDPRIVAESMETTSMEKTTSDSVMDDGELTKSLSDSEMDEGGAMIGVKSKEHLTTVEVEEANSRITVGLNQMSLHPDPFQVPSEPRRSSRNAMAKNKSSLKVPAPPKPSNSKRKAGFKKSLIRIEVSDPNNFIHKKLNKC